MHDVKNEPTLQGRANPWLVLAKLTIGVLLITVLVARADVSALISRLRSVNLYYVACVFVLPHIMILTSTVKWQMFLRELGLRVRLARLFGLYLIGTFFSNFLPTMVGGDAIRAYALGRETQDTSAVVAAIFMERVTGFAALVSLLPLALLSTVVTARYPVVWLFVTVCIIGFAASMAVVLSSSVSVVAGRLRKFALVARVAGFLGRTRSSIRLAARSPGTLVAAYAMSIVFYIGAAANVWLATRSLGAHVGMFYLLATVPLVLVAGMLPVSLNGLGITEAGFAVVLQLAGMPLPDAVAVGLILRARLFFTGLLGGLLFLRHRADRGRER